MFTQTVVVPLTNPWSLADLRAALSSFEVLKELEPSDSDAGFWMSGEGGLTLAGDSGPNAGVALTLFNRPWPDGMGDPKGDVWLFGAWATRQFGLSTFPLCLARAAAFSPSGRDAATAAMRTHTGFVRCNFGYLFGEAGPDAKIFPEGRDARAEHRFLARLADALLEQPGALGWFVPGGEVFRLGEECREDLRRQAEGEFVPKLWVQVRSRPAGRNVLLETVGLRPFGEKPMACFDHQLVISSDGVEPEQADRFLAQVSRLERLGSDEAPSEPVLGPGGRWLPEVVEDDGPPPRELVRWRLEGSEPDVRQVAEMSEEESKAWLAHLTKHLGGSSTVFHELVSDVVHLDVHFFPPTPERPFHVLVTQGMSALAMAVPEGAEELRHAELLIALQEHWPLGDDAFKNERHYWPVRALKFVARLPHLYETWIGAGHTIPNGDPAKPFAESTKLCGVIVGAPATLPKSIRCCELSPGKTVHLYALYPIHLDEMDFKLEHGADALFDKMEARKVDEVLDPKRRSVLARRFWIV